MRSPEVLYLKPRLFNLKKKAILLLLALTSSLFVLAQTTDISGVVNTYHKVIEIIPAKACLRVANISGLNVNSRVMVIQMKGASIQTATGSTFGDTISLNNAGNYEIGTVCYIIGDSVFLFHNLMNSYTESTGKVQLVQFGEYYSANVVDTVKAMSWDSAAGLGGVIAIYCDQDLTLNEPIYADTAGYKGGAYIDYTGNCPVGGGYVYDASAQGFNEGAYKGESIANLAGNIDGGKGAPANGGGGGNNHNNSGAGGANLSAGGNGGANSSSGPFGCNSGGNYGRGGKALSSWGGTKIFVGGGGGCGHSNNGSPTSNYGANGGGIIFIWANNINGNGQLITAGGGVGGSSASDGAGGGGAGGTIIMHVTNYTGALSVKADGGSGGLSVDGGVIGRCFGGGGGGSGGVIYYTGSAPAITYTASSGPAGLEIQRDAGCNAAQPGSAGAAGSTIFNYTFSRSSNSAGYCQLLLPVKLVNFQAIVVDKKVKLDWQIENPADVKQFVIERSVTGEQWSELKQVGGNDITSSYFAIDEHPLPGRSYYRIRFIERSNAFSYSPVRKVFLDGDQQFVIYPNPAKDRIVIAGNMLYPAYLSLRSVGGQLIMQQKLSTSPAVIELPALPAGIYMVEINGKVQKLIVY